ncbi:MAG: zinc-ribbon domain-containing protein [Candidatus Heimdallarchaeota archaeon]
MSKRNDICPYCGSALEGGSEFCQNCGASLSVVESTTSVRIISESQPSPSYSVVQPQTTTYVPRKQDFFRFNCSNTWLDINLLTNCRNDCFNINFLVVLKTKTNGNLKILYS